MRWERRVRRGRRERRERRLFPVRYMFLVISVCEAVSFQSSLSFKVAVTMSKERWSSHEENLVLFLAIRDYTHQACADVLIAIFNVSRTYVAVRCKIKALKDEISRGNPLCSNSKTELDASASIWLVHRGFKFEEMDEDAKAIIRRVS